MPRVDYSKYNFCQRCDVKYLKPIVKCIGNDQEKGCGKRLRQKGRKQKRKIYVPVPDPKGPWRTRHEILEMMETSTWCVPTNPQKEHRY